MVGVDLNKENCPEETVVEKMKVDQGTDSEDSEAEEVAQPQRGRRSLRVRNKPDSYVAVPASGTCAEGKMPNDDDGKDLS